MMRNWYHCRICNCLVDPGENYLCDDCRKILIRREQKAEQAGRAFMENVTGQVKMKLSKA